ncbi:hypothetical protein HII13_005245 [Brettanomyces bruxellensis]|nr:uncharacterized protein BRETT_002970 [Brettanomyces bruxellensis]KAF6006125.1 hypothetical protein HII13_005245 [Brettanomyces bruxellensis]QOU22785.1 hypothetical protein BRETT_002970 [Brettanomyces bruxellensis]
MVASTEQEKPSEVSEEKAKVIKTLEEDDEFEDFPEDDWTDDKAVGSTQHGHLWDDSWEDHDDDNDNFTQKLA